MLKQPIYDTALYYRLSRDDDNEGESNSIATQRMMLRRYAEENGLRVVDEYIDDGYSGTNFDRPDFQRMIGDIEAGKINCVVTKDLSRLGRNYLLTGQYMEMYFPVHGVRYIAVDNGVDSNNKQDNDFTPFLNIINEWYAKDISRKVQRAMHTRFENGAHYGAYAPLGYVKDPDKKGHLLIDPETKWIIEKIYALAVQGAGAAKITRILTAEQVPTPAWWNYQRYGTFAHVFVGEPESKKYAWTIAQVKSILHDENYIGNSIHNKQTNISFKCKKKVRKRKDEWWRVENTPEAIVSKDDFDQVQEHIDTRRRRQRDGQTQIFSGLVKCADCGWSMAYGVNRQNTTPYGHYHCSKYSQGLHQCTMHYIRYDVLYAYVLSRLQYWIQAIHRDGEAMEKRLLQATDEEHASANKRAEMELQRAKKRLTELDNLLAKLYEDSVAGKINERNFDMLSQKYQQEQEETESKIQTLTAQLKESRQQTEGVEKWIDLLRQFSSPTELTAELLNALVEKILVHETTKNEDGNRVQEVEIFYRFVGKID